MRSVYRSAARRLRKNDQFSVAEQIDVVVEQVDGHHPTPIISKLTPPFIKGSSQMSKLRWFFTLSSIVVLTLLTMQSVMDTDVDIPITLVIFAMTFSMAYFICVVVTVIFMTDQHFRVNPVRLTIDALTSTILTVVAFSTSYRYFGLSLGEGCDQKFTNVDTIYFSAVTFSTLGYGDFRPCPPARLIAAMEALLGNLHLGVLVGAAFMVATSGGPSGNDKPEERADNAST